MFIKQQCNNNNKNNQKKKTKKKKKRKRVVGFRGYCFVLVDSVPKMHRDARM